MKSSILQNVIKHCNVTLFYGCKILLYVAIYAFSKNHFKVHFLLNNSLKCCSDWVQCVKLKRLKSFQLQYKSKQKGKYPKQKYLTNLDILIFSRVKSSYF